MAPGYFLAPLSRDFVSHAIVSVQLTSQIPPSAGSTIASNLRPIRATSCWLEFVLIIKPLYCSDRRDVRNRENRLPIANGVVQLRRRPLTSRARSGRILSAEAQVAS